MLFCIRFHLVSFCIQNFATYIDSPPSKSLGRYELRLEGVPLAGSELSNGGAAHRLPDDGLLGQPVLQVSAAAGCLLEPRHDPDEPLC